VHEINLHLTFNWGLCNPVQVGSNQRLLNWYLLLLR